MRNDGAVDSGGLHEPRTPAIPAGMERRFALKDRLNYRIARIGPEAAPLIVIDGVLRDPQAVVDFAAGDTGYGPAGAAYPGLRAPLPSEYARHIYGALRPLLHQVFGVPLDQQLNMNSSFAMVTDPPEMLGHHQRVPHTDVVGDYNLAMVHYLCDHRFGGTAFFAHRSTGWQSITAEREEAYQRSVQLEVNRIVLPASFPGEDHPLFERVAIIPSQFDRLVIYSSSILHSPAIAPRSHFSADPREGRLTITSFLTPVEMLVTS